MMCSVCIVASTSAAEQKFSTCQNAIIQANTNAKLQYITNTIEFLNIQNSSAPAKISGENLEVFDRVYSCHLKAVCQAIKSISAEDEVLTDTIGCTARSVADLESDLGMSFEACQTPDTQVQTENLWSQCEAVTTVNIRSGRVEIAKEIQHVVSIENQGNLGAKVLDMRKRMAVLIDKTRIFAYNFTKVINDAACTIAQKSQ